MDTFEFDGEKYKFASKHQKEWGNDLISKLSFKGNETVLDLGCGDGILTEQLSLFVPYGKVLWDFGGFGNCCNFIDVVQKKILENNYAKYFENFEWPWFLPSKEQYTELISTIGFATYTIKGKNRDRYFSNTEEIIRWIDQPCIVPFIKYIPDELKENFRQEIIEEMLKRTQQPDGTCFETFRRIQIYARK